MDKRTYNKKMKKYAERNKQYEMKLRLREEKYRYRHKPHLPSTSKLMSLYLFFILTIILVYVMIAMWYFADLTYLGALVTDIAGYVINFSVYAKKSAIENSKGGIIYETAMSRFSESQEQIEGLDFADEETEIPINDTGGSEDDEED